MPIKSGQSTQAYRLHELEGTVKAMDARLRDNVEPALTRLADAVDELRRQKISPPGEGPACNSHRNDLAAFRKDIDAHKQTTERQYTEVVRKLDWVIRTGVAILLAMAGWALTQLWDAHQERQAANRMTMGAKA